MRRKMVCVLDTETCNGIMVDDKLDLSCSLVYDIGWQIVDLHENIYVKRSFVIYETFVGMKDVMRSAYYAEKIPRYEADIKLGLRKLVRFDTARKILWADMELYDCSIVSAHNARFDYNALNNTMRYLTKSAYRYFFPYNTIIWDTLKMARQTYYKEVGYRHFCEENGFMTNHKTPQPRLTAEIIFRYMSGNEDFIESHTGLEDVEIETEILWAIVKKHKKLDRALW